MSERMMWAAWRVWAADVRDRVGLYRGVARPTAERAKTLVALLDAWEKCQGRPTEITAANLCDGLEASIESLTAQILAAGVPPPAELSRIASR